MCNQIFIGDNLKVFNDANFKKYIGKVKCIYIDPPYNTKSTKTYCDKLSNEKWGEEIKQRLHSASYFLDSDGCIFISIDDNEYAFLKLICDDVFGRENYVGTMITKQALRSNAKWINTVHEYVLCYAKNKKNLKPFVVKRIDIPDDKLLIDDISKRVKCVFKSDGQVAAEKELKKIIKKLVETSSSFFWIRNYSNVDEKGNIFFATDLSTPGKPRIVDIPEIGLHLEPLKTRGWSSDERFVQLHKQNRLFFKKDGRPYAIHYLSESEENAPSIINFYSRQGTEDLKKLGLQGLFDTPKPVSLLKYLIRLTNFSEGLIMDFYAGSGSTAQAVYEINKEDNKHLEYILIQRPELINKETEAYQLCEHFSIKPTIDSVLQYRINKFLTIASQDYDYELITL